MEQVIRHRRLHAFYQSKVLNGLMILIVVCLLMAIATGYSLFPLICGGVCMLLFSGYSLWLWIGKPDAIVINGVVSNVNGLYTLYYLLILVFDGISEWWYMAPALLAVGVLLVCLCGYKDEQFIIKKMPSQ